MEVRRAFCLESVDGSARAQGDGQGTACGNLMRGIYRDGLCLTDMTRAEVNQKAWITRRTNEAKVAGTFPEERMEERNYKYPSNPRIDDAIKEAYRLFRECNDRTAIGNPASRIGWPRHRINKRARAIGLSRTKEARWAPTEEWILNRWGHLVDAAIQTKLKKAGYHRSLTAVHLKVRRLRIKQNLYGYSANQLAEAFGIDRHKIAAWIARGALPAERRGTARTSAQGGDMYWIRRDDVRAFILKYPEEIELAKVEKIWFLDLLTNGEVAK
jgi:hypothetical protein